MRSLGHSFLVVVLLGALVAGCAGSGEKAGSTAQGTAAEPRLNWRTWLIEDSVGVEVRDPDDAYKVERIELVDPEGSVTAASEITRETVRDDDRGFYGGPGVSVGGSVGSSGRSGVGLGLSFPLGGTAPRRSPPLKLTKARIPLTDPDSYRATAGDWRVRLHLLGRDNAPRVAEIPAPVPPEK